MNYLKSAIRHLWKNKLFSLINITGLALGLSCCFIIMLHVKFELGYDRYQTKGDRIVRVLNNDYSFTPPVFASLAPEYFPEIDKIARIGKADGPGLFVVRNKEFLKETDLVYSDSTFFAIFSNRVLAGNPETVLRSPDKIMISEKMALKYYGTRNPAGNSLTLRITNTSYNFIIEGVFADFSEQSHFHANFIVSMEFFRKLQGPAFFTNWGANSVHTYLLLKRPGLESNMMKRMPGFMDKYVDQAFAKNMHISLQPLYKIHLYSKEANIDIEPQGSISRVIIFTSIAILILVVAIINFVLLSLAMSYKRIKQFGIRKILGAQQRDQVFLVSAEFFIVFVLAIQIAFMTVEFSIPFVKAHMGMNIFKEIFADTSLIFLFVGVVVLLGYWSSLYIILNISHIQPVEALKNIFPPRYWWLPSQGVLVVFQFCVMICLLVSLMVMHKQLQMIRNKDLGYNKDFLVNITIPFNSGNKYQLFRNELNTIPGIVKVSGAAYIPPSGQWWIASMKNPVNGETFQVEEINADYDLVETLDVQMISGRTFSRNYGSDSLAIIMNESAVKLFKMSSPLGLSLVRDGDTTQTKKEIIGVFRDFNTRSLYEKSQPMVIFLSPQMVQQMAVRLSSAGISSTLRKIENKWTNFFPEDPIQYSFVNEALKLNYSKNEQIQTLVSVFAFISLLIALLGLFGLTNFTLERRTKETGIRKINGASVTDIFFILSRQFAVWILVAFVIAIPISWYAMHHWLNQFAYQIQISWWIFLLALLISLLVAGITLCWQTYKASIQNPVEALRNE